MSREAVSDAMPDADVGEYCRRVEEHLTRVNEGQLVRVAGTGFEVVRAWALDGIPLSVACRGIDQKADRHRAGTARRPLRVEFCEADVRQVFDDWRRAVGVMALAWTPEPADPENSEPVEGAVPTETRRPPSLTRQIDRAVEKLVRAGGRLDLPDSLRDALTHAIEALVLLRESAAHARGVARDALVARVPEIDAQLMAAARAAASADAGALTREAAGELAAYRMRLSPEAWNRAVQAGVDRLIRDRFGLPTLDAHGN